MDNQNTIYAVLGAVVLGLLILSIAQCSNNRSHKRTIAVQQDSLFSYERSLILEKRARREMESETDRLTIYNQDLELEKEDLNSEITRLMEQVDELRRKLKNSQGALSRARSQIASKERDLKNIEVRLDSFNLTDDQVFASRIDTINNQLEILKLENRQLQKEKEGMRSEISAIKAERERYKSSLDIIENTTISYQLVSPRKEKEGKEIKRLKKNNWNYTQIEFSMFHDDMSVLEGSRFIIKIIDSDTRQPLALRETNQAYPLSSVNATGITYEFQNNPIIMTFVNNEFKYGDNYEINLFQVSNNDEVLMHDGIIDFIRRAKPVAIGF
ncbi:MAG: hypothetical protein AAF502_23365 [Bacteroidota bacterium]